MSQAKGAAFFDLDRTLLAGASVLLGFFQGALGGLLRR